MPLQILIYDRNGNPVYDPEESVLRATPPRFSTSVNGGFAGASFELIRSEPFVSWTVRESYQVKLYDGQRLVYEGDIIDIQQVSDGKVVVSCSGRQWLLGKTEVSKIWIDRNVAAEFTQPDDNATPVNVAFNVQVGQTYIRASFGEVNTRDSETPYDADDFVHTVEYDTRGLGKIRRVEGIMSFRCDLDEGVRCKIYNVDQAVTEATITGADPSGSTTSINTTLTGGSTEAVKFIIGPASNDAKYASDDRMALVSLILYCHYHPDHPNYSSPSYTSAQLMYDVLYEGGLAGDTISEDFSQVENPNVAISPFGERKALSVAKHLDNILAYGDGSNNTYYWFIWGSNEASDGKSIFAVSARDVSDWEYEADSRQPWVKSIDITRSGQQLKNYYSVEYVGADGKPYLLTPADNSDLKNQTSINNEYRRDATISIGNSTATLAGQIGQTQRSKYDTRRLKGSIEVIGEIALKGDKIRVPACWVRAGQRVYLPELAEVVYIGSTDYDDKTGVLTITADEPPDTLEAILARNALSYGDNR